MGRDQGKSEASREGAQTNVLLVEDHPITRQGLKLLIDNEPDLTVCGEASDAQYAMNAIEKQRPDIVVVDITLPKKSGLELIKDVYAIYPDIKTLVLSMHDEALYAERVLRAGGRGYLMKDEGGEKLLVAIRRVLEGQIYVSDRMASSILESFSGGNPSKTKASLIKGLTDREFEVFQLIGRGKGTREIAEALHVSVKTIEAHRQNIKEKLKCQTAPEMVRYAVRWEESNFSSES